MGETSAEVDSRWTRAPRDHGVDSSGVADGWRWIVAVSSWVYLGNLREQEAAEADRDDSDMARMRYGAKKMCLAMPIYNLLRLQRTSWLKAERDAMPAVVNVKCS